MTKRNFTSVFALNQGKKRKLLTTDEFIRRAKIVHGERYDYSITKYIKASSKLDIICKTHGAFKQLPHNHLRGVNCPKCGAENRKAYSTGLSKRASREFEVKANEQHNYFYDYSLVEYKRSRVKVKIICPNHGEFKQTPHEHINGAGCPKCARKRISKAINKRRLKAKESFEIKANAKHGGKYCYSKSDYINNHTRVDIICPIHGLFQQTPRAHLSGKGCFECGREFSAGWSKTDFVSYAEKTSNGKAKLYIIKCWSDSELFYKIGITTRSVKNRYPSKRAMPYSFKLVKLLEGDAGFIYDKETELHRANKKNHYTPKKPFYGSILECFSDIGTIII